MDSLQWSSETFRDVILNYSSKIMQNNLETSRSSKVNPCQIYQECDALFWHG